MATITTTDSLMRRHIGNLGQIIPDSTKRTFSLDSLKLHFGGAGMQAVCVNSFFLADDNGAVVQSFVDGLHGLFLPSYNTDLGRSDTLFRLNSALFYANKCESFNTEPQKLWFSVIANDLIYSYTSPSPSLTLYVVTTEFYDKERVFVMDSVAQNVDLNYAHK